MRTSESEGERERERSRERSSGIVQKQHELPQTLAKRKQEEDGGQPFSGHSGGCGLERRKLQKALALT